MSATHRVCLDLTPSEMRDRFGGFTRYGLALLHHLRALPPGARDGIELLVLGRSDARPVPAEQVDLTALVSGPLIDPARHFRQRRGMAGRALRAARVDLFHALHPESTPWRCGCPIVATVHDLVPEVRPEPGEPAWQRAKNALWRRWNHRRPDHLIAISRTTRDDLQRVMHIAAPRIDVVHHGVDMRRFSPEPACSEEARLRRLGVPPRFFLAVGSDQDRKNQRRLFDAWKDIAGRVPEALVFVGRALYGTTFATILSAARDLDLASRVAWFPDLGDDDLPAVYRSATALAAPSEYEGFGMTLLEAMACGTPVCASTAPAHVEVAEEAALFFDPLSLAEISEALLRMSAEAETRQRLRAAGLERARQFTWSRCASETMAVYRKLLGRTR